MPRRMSGRSFLRVRSVIGLKDSTIKSPLYPSITSTSFSANCTASVFSSAVRVISCSFIMLKNKKDNKKENKINQVITKEDFELASTDKEFRHFESKTRKIGFR